MRRGGEKVLLLQAAQELLVGFGVLAAAKAQRELVSGSQGLVHLVQAAGGFAAVGGLFWEEEGQKPALHFVDRDGKADAVAVLGAEVWAEQALEADFDGLGEGVGVGGSRDVEANLIADIGVNVKDQQVAVLEGVAVAAVAQRLEQDRPAARGVAAMCAWAGVEWRATQRDV